MWMKSRFATWEAEGQAEERIQRALCEGERWRLGQIASGQEAGRHYSRFAAAASRGLHRLIGRVAGWLAGWATAVWPNGQTGAATYKPELEGQSSVVRHEPKARSHTQEEWIDAS